MVAQVPRRGTCERSEQARQRWSRDTRIPTQTCWTSLHWCMISKTDSLCTTRCSGTHLAWSWRGEFVLRLVSKAFDTLVLEHEAWLFACAHTAQGFRGFLRTYNRRNVERIQKQVRCARLHDGTGVSIDCDSESESVEESDSEWTFDSETVKVCARVGVTVRVKVMSEFQLWTRRNSLWLGQRLRDQ